MDRHLMAFLTVAEKRNFTRAAEELNLTQSAVSREIETLEAEFGAKLFDRSSKFVRLTRAGEILYFHGKNVLNEYTTARRLIRDLAQAPSGQISIGSGYTFGEYLLPNIIARLKAVHPQVTPKITIMNSRRIGLQVLHREVDVGIVEGELELKDVVTRPFAQDELVVVVSASHRLAGVEEVTFDQLNAETWILREQGSGTRTVTDQVFHHHGLTPTSMMEFGSTQIIKESVQAGLGISILSKCAIEREVQFRLLHALHIKDYRISRKFFSVVYASQFQPKAVSVFLNLLHHDAESF